MMFRATARKSELKKLLWMDAAY